MKKTELEKYLNKNIVVVFDRTKASLNNSKFLSGKLIDLNDTSLTITMSGCSYGSEICVSFDVVLMVGLKDEQE